MNVPYCGSTRFDYLDSEEIPLIYAAMQTHSDHRNAELLKENEHIKTELQRVRTDLIEQLRITAEYYDREKELLEQRKELLEALESMVANAPRETLDADWWEDSFKQSFQNADALIKKYLTTNP